VAGRVAGKVAFITGAARGQGRSHAVRLAEEGADIIAIDSLADNDTVPYALANESDLAETVRQVEALGRRIVASRADVRDQAALDAQLAAGIAELGRLDIVCANAGIASFGPAHELSEHAWHEVIDINLSGVWRTCKAAIPRLIEQGEGGAIVLISSAAGLRAYQGLAHYTSAKHGVVGLMKNLAQELAPHRIRVNAINPTQVDTDMVQNQAMYDTFCSGVENPTREDFARASGETILYPIPWVEPVDVSNALLFLVSEEARYVTGVALPIDGGVLVK
jgi:(+)-trans-carveol dehydrogenase